MDNIIIDEEFILKVVALYYIYHYKSEEINEIYNIPLNIINEIITINNNDDILNKLRMNKTFVIY